MKILVCLWNYLVEYKIAEDPDTALEKLREKLKQFKSMTEQFEIGDKNCPFNSIFLAPEYLFHSKYIKKSEGKSNVRQLLHFDYHLLEEEKNSLKGKLLALSYDFQKILLVPGSIAWKKKINKPKKVTELVKKILSSKDYGLQSIKNNSITDTSEAKLIRQRCSEIQLMDFCIKYKEGKTDVPISGKLSNKTIAKTTQEKIKELESAEYIAKNTAFVLMNGQVILIYNKASDFHEVLNEPKVVFIPGNKVGGFSISGFSFCLQICSDNYFPIMPNIPVDVHLLISASVETNPDNANIKNNGWLIHCSSWPDKAKVMSKGGDVPEKVYSSDETFVIYSINIKTN